LRLHDGSKKRRIIFRQFDDFVKLLDACEDLDMQIRKIEVLPAKENREKGLYWVKPLGDDWGVYMFNESWGIFGWWGIAEGMAIYDKDIEFVGDFLEPPQHT
jgi:hypothetical protein